MKRLLVVLAAVLPLFTSAADKVVLRCDNPATEQVRIRYEVLSEGSNPYEVRKFLDGKKSPMSRCPGGKRLPGTAGRTPSLKTKEDRVTS